ncbi:beta-1,6-N-acetylglucosaminyltransferase [Pediococcus acidilactici]|uniref:beta-1,6-N-acetylglucosaminyltransferase n=1 Tax=Pediococcus acidilactici TaxID=1254 RepID=UPI001BD443F9|nr:beta-1,6-N-acetylglucosaminyltransferase [Pediococcus acidilactici]MBS9398434.1 hypothetical protein [Pediococcus acidilactici]
MKQAILVIGNGASDVLQQTINILDDVDIDFIVYWDAKDNLPRLKSSDSNIYFVEPRKKIYWGTDTQIMAEHDLMEYALKLNIDYTFLHLISSKDIPLMEKSYFKSYFSNSQKEHIGFVATPKEDVINRIKFYYPIRHLKVRNKLGQKLIKLIVKVNSMLKIDRLSNSNEIEKGTNWFSVSRELVQEVIDYPNLKMFMNSYLGDEIYIQTILRRYKPKDINDLQDDNEMAGRLIDWKHGNPYIFTKDDVNYLRNNVNTKFAFARKVEDADVPKMVFK